MFAVRSRRTVKITRISRAVSASKPGAPTSSMKPVSGSEEISVGVGVTVKIKLAAWVWATAAWVNKAWTVAVRGSIVGPRGRGVSEGTPSTVEVALGSKVAVGVSVGSGVFVFVGVDLRAIAVRVMF